MAARKQDQILQRICTPTFADPKMHCEDLAQGPMTRFSDPFRKINSENIKKSEMPD
jgi:hypothetical protein